tara:strand:+ start:1200 stop:1781 length:582 start_codon:yes stop_codon:yes gene_type:complete
VALLSRAGDLFYAFRFLRMLTTSWEDTKAFSYGIIDDKGKVLKKAKTLKTPAEKAAYTVFHRLVFNIKRLLQKAPGGGSKLASYAAALFLIKEQTDMTEEDIQKVMSKLLDSAEELEESKWFQEDNKLRPGTYILTDDICSPVTGEVIALEKSKIKVDNFLEPVDRLFEQNIYKVKHALTGQEIYITNREIKR